MSRFSCGRTRRLCGDYVFLVWKITTHHYLDLHLPLPPKFAHFRRWRRSLPNRTAGCKHTNLVLSTIHRTWSRPHKPIRISPEARKRHNPKLERPPADQRAAAAAAPDPPIGISERTKLRVLHFTSKHPNIQTSTHQHLHFSPFADQFPASHPPTRENNSFFSMTSYHARPLTLYLPCSGSFI